MSQNPMGIERAYKSSELGHKSSDFTVGVVTAQFNWTVTEQLEAGALAFLRDVLKSDRIRSVRVPGAFEIPLAAKAFLESGCDGVVALGAVIRGETSHYDYVCQAVERGCSQLQLELGKPIAFGVLTTEDESQAKDRAGGKHGNKGRDAAQALIEMMNLLNDIRGGTV